MSVDLGAFGAPHHHQFVWEHGPHAALLVHGFPGTPAEMRTVGKHLHDLGLTVHGLLLPGFGPDIPSLSKRDHTEWIETVDRGLASLQRKHERVILVGNSMGAALVLRVAARRRADGLVLFAPFWRVDTWLDRVFPVAQRLIPKIRPFAVGRFDNPKFRDEIRHFFPDADLDDPAVQKAIRRIALPTRVLGQVRRSGQLGYDFAEQVEAPTLIIQGIHDRLVRPLITQQLAARLPNLTGLIEVPGEHTIVEGDSEEWPQVVLVLQEFVANVTAASGNVWTLRTAAHRGQGIEQ